MPSNFSENEFMTLPINAGAPIIFRVLFTIIIQAIEELTLTIKFKEMFLEILNLIFKLICNVRLN